MQKIAWLLINWFTLSPSLGQEAERNAIERYVRSHQAEIVSTLRQALSIPDVAADRANIRKKAQFLAEQFRRRGFDSRLLETQGNPLVFGELKVDGAHRTILIYCHYDGQPTDSSQWRQSDPFVPVLRDGQLEEDADTLDVQRVQEFSDDWRIYARSASDDTSPIIALLAAVDALRAEGQRLGSHLKIILDGEEEAGSPSLVPAIEQYQQELSADLMLILDGPIHPSDRVTMVFGARGIQTLQLTVYGPKFPLHSGHYGNWVPNPAMRLAQLVASMKDSQGRTTISGFYDDIDIPPSERRIMSAVPDDLDALKKLFGISEPDRVGENLQEARNYPSLNIRGLRSGWVGSEARTIVPDRALAEIDVRLVPETPPEIMLRKVVGHIERQGYHVVSEDPDDSLRARFPRLAKVVAGAGTRAYRTPMDHPLSVKLYQHLRDFLDQEPVRIRTSGGTVPISPFVETLGFPAISLPIVNFDNNQHSPNENLRLGHFFRGIVVIAAALTM